jgi:hypothetical protein
MYSRIAASSRPTVETKYPLAQKFCPTKLHFLSPYVRAKWIALLPLMKTDRLRNRIFRWDRDHHVNVIRHQVTLFDPAFLLQRQLAKHILEVLSHFSAEHLPAVLGNEHPWYLHSHLVWLIPFP